MIRGNDISRRSYLSLFGSASFLTILGSGTAATKYEDWQSQSLQYQEMKIIGHRGANGLAPQNSEAGIRKAVQYNVDGVELDVQKTSDGKLVLFHDPIYDFATENGTGFVNNVPYSEAKEFHQDGHYVLTLSEALEIITDEDLELYLEIKTEGIYEDCIKILKSYDWLDKTTFISLESTLLDPFTNHQTALINSTPYDGHFRTAKQLDCDGIGVHYNPVQENFIQEANQLQFESIIWSLVDVKANIKDSLKSDADVLIANRPDIIQEIITQND